MPANTTISCDDCRRIASSDSKILRVDRFSGDRDDIRDAWVKNRWKNPGYYCGEVIGPFVMEFKCSFKDLKESAEKGCNCCLFFIESIRAFGEATPKEGKLFLVRHTEEVGATAMRVGGDGRPRSAPTPAKIAKEGDYVCLYEETIPLARYNLCVKGLDSIHDLRITRRQISKSAGSRECMEYVLKRLQDCSQNHPGCDNTPSAYLPSRLLDLGMIENLPATGKSKIRLTITAGKLASNERYTALSHCWGIPSLRPIMTTSSNLEAHINGIDFADLPPSFRDAVTVTKSLGIRYLWIDSLCIIQDSMDDWATESSLMADIYQSATLTIAGSCAKDSRQGLFGTRDSIYAGNSILLPGQEGLPEDDKIIIQFYRKHFESFKSPPEPLEFAIQKHFTEPLGTRAWTLQERLLSERTIFYDNTQLFWECQSARYIEGWTKDLKQMEVDKMARKGRQFQRVNKPTFSDELGLLGANMENGYNGQTRWRHTTLARYCWWYEMLEEYRSRDITVATDALPALSGIAKQFATKTGDAYVAGIWRGDVLGGLTWRVDITSGEPLMQRYQTFINQKATGPQPIEECFAPSWSWASVLDRAGRIFRPTSQGGDVLKGHQIDEDTAPPIIPLGFRNRHARVIEIEVVPRSSNHMGHILSGKLVVEALCRKITVRRRKLGVNRYHGEARGFFIFEMDGLESKHLNQYLFCSIDHPHWLENCLKKAEALGREYILTCVFLKNTSGLHCLLLEDGRGGGLWRRCGVVNIEYRLQEFESGWQMEKLSII